MRFELFFSCIISFFFLSIFFFVLFLTMGSTYNLSCESTFQMSDEYMGCHMSLIFIFRHGVHILFFFVIKWFGYWSLSLSLSAFSLALRDIAI